MVNRLPRIFSISPRHTHICGATGHHPSVVVVETGQKEDRTGPDRTAGDNWPFPSLFSSNLVEESVFRKNKHPLQHNRLGADGRPNLPHHPRLPTARDLKD